MTHYENQQNTRTQVLSFLDISTWKCSIVCTWNHIIKSFGFCHFSCVFAAFWVCCDNSQQTIYWSAVVLRYNMVKLFEATNLGYSAVLYMRQTLKDRCGANTWSLTLKHLGQSPPGDWLQRSNPVISCETSAKLHKAKLTSNIFFPKVIG